MKALIIYPKDRTFFIELPNDADIIKNLSACWTATNPDSGDETITKLNKQFKAFDSKMFGIRSSMVGDIFVINDRYFFVDGVGFKEISAAQSVFIQSLPERDGIMGWGFLESKYPKLGEPIEIMI